MKNTAGRLNFCTENTKINREGLPNGTLRGLWSWWPDLNRRPADYESAALPTEPHQHNNNSILDFWHKSRGNGAKVEKIFWVGYFCSRQPKRLQSSPAWILTCRRLKFCATFIVYFRQNCAIIQIERLWLSVIFCHKNCKNRRKSVRAGPAADAWLHRRYHIGRKISRIRQHRTGRRHFWQL